MIDRFHQAKHCKRGSRVFENGLLLSEIRYIFIWNSKTTTIHEAVDRKGRLNLKSIILLTARTAHEINLVHKR